MQNKPQLLIVASRGLAELVRLLMPEYAARFDIRLLDKPLDEALRDAQELQRNGQLDVLLAAGQTGLQLRQTLASPLVQIKVGGDDIMHALARARRLAGKVAIVTRQDIGDEVLAQHDLAIERAADLEFGQCRRIARHYRGETAGNGPCQ